MNDVGVVYLARAAEGEAPVKRFIDSYCNHAAGIPHDLIVVFKGFDDQNRIGHIAGLFRDIAHVSMQMEDVGYDIGAYFHVARSATYKTLCFLNSFSEIAAGDWLRSMVDALDVSGVSLVGASGSYESIQDTTQVFMRLCWLLNVERIRVTPRLRDRFEFLFQVDTDPRWLADGSMVASDADDAVALNYFNDPEAEQRFQVYWRRRVLTDLAYVLDFPHFPNAHIRSNGFMIRRATLLSLFPDIDTSDKRAAYNFECGPSSLTRRIKVSGASAMVVDRAGRAWPESSWAESNTFRLGRQEGLLIRDNQTARYDSCCAAAQASYQAMTWGLIADDTPFTNDGRFRTIGPVH